LFDGRFRTGVDRAVRPVGNALRSTGLSPDHLTAFGLLLGVPTAVVIGSGHLFIGLLLLIFSAVPDLLDGALAKASGRSSVRGAFFDSVCDRVTDTLVLGGLGWYLQDHHHGHAFLLPFAILGASLLISYERAKAESLGFDAKGGLMERAERVIVLCAGLAFSVVLVPLLWVMLGLTLITAVQRFVKVWRQATVAGAAATVPVGAVSSPTVAGAGVADSDEDLFGVDRPAAADDRPAGVPAGRWMAGHHVAGAPELAVSARWRAWREANGWAPGPSRYARSATAGGSGERWRERRRARLAAEGRPVTRRRSGSRRP
jgi:CDP-diacylglycerol--glycerol-3-phosphate 3-phosphatidyltransferase